MPPAGISDNIFEMSRKEREELGIRTLPGSLLEAERAFEKDTFIQEVLGEDLTWKFIRAKKAEYQVYRRQVTDWEIGEYLQKY